MKDRMFFDTNILYYSFDKNAGRKRELCKSLIKRVMEGQIIGVVSNQVLGETFNTATKKMGMPSEQARVIVDLIIHSERWEKVNYTFETARNAMDNTEGAGLRFWDLVIAETMKENGITKIITEDVRGFNGLSGINVINPFEN